MENMGYRDEVKLFLGTAAPADAQALVAFAVEKQGVIGDLPAAVAAVAKRVFAAWPAKGKARQSIAHLLENRGGKPQWLILAGLGDGAKLDLNCYRHAAAAACRLCGKYKLSHVCVYSHSAVNSVSAADAAAAIAEGWILAAYRFEELKGTAAAPADKENQLPTQSVRLALAGGAISPAVKNAVRRASVIAQAQNLARTLANRPANIINPPSLAKAAGELARQTPGLRCKVLSEGQLAKLNMNGLLAVGGGSIDTPPRLIVLEYRPAQNKTADPVLLVGKSITFDTGGISIKPADKMGKMIYDKCGGTTVLAIMIAAARLKLPMPLVGLLAAAENHVSHKAYRPGDVLRMHNGVTVEVTNTDAEGRLVLADGLAWGIENYHPRAAVDLATLTGGVIVALGKQIAGVMTRHTELFEQLQKAGQKSGENLWRLPLGEEQREQIKSDAADIVNSAGRDGQPLQGGAFLSYFVDEKLPWAHIDIAGVADTEKDLPQYGKGATGWGVRTLINWLEQLNVKGR